MDSIGQRTISKVMWRIVPFTMALYLINVMDRVNLGYAALQMNKELSIGTAAFGTLAAAFFVGYFFFEVPSNIILEKVGSRTWIARIMITWGIVTCLKFFAQEFWHIYALQVALGIMEAGFFPGIIFYFTLWFPTKERAWVTSLFFVGAQVGTLIGSPLAAWVMDNVAWLGMSGWRWVFFIEGIPAILLGIATWFYLTNKPEDAKWLLQEEKDWLIGKLSVERQQNKVEKISIGKAFASIRVWQLAGIYFFFQIGSQTIAFWIPQIVKSISGGLSNTTIGLILMLPPIFGIVFMMIWGRHSDRSGERKVHVVVPILVSVFGIALTVISDNQVVRIIGMIFAQGGTAAVYGPFWALPAVYLTGTGAAVGIAIINSCSSAAGFVGNTVVGAIASAAGNNAALVFLAASFAIAIGLALSMRMKDVALDVDTGKIPEAALAVSGGGPVR